MVLTGYMLKTKEKQSLYMYITAPKSMKNSIDTNGNPGRAADHSPPSSAAVMEE